MLTDLLRLETRVHHERMEELNELPENRADYVALLASFYGFIAPWEAAVARVLPADDPVREGRAKTPWLEEDLEFFGCDAVRRAALPRAEALPSVASRAHILGAAYVLEGSTLGGQFIAQHVERTLGLGDGQGCRFYRSYGRDVRRRWDEFRGELLRVSSPEVDPIVLHAARTTFDQLHLWFSAQKACAA